MAVRLAWLRRLAPLAPMPGAAFIVHQLRYWLAFGRLSGLQLERQGHAYLNSLVPWLVLALAVAVGVFLRALGRAWAGRRSPTQQTLSFAALWLLCAASLLAIYATQECLEGLWASGHPGGLSGIFGYGGWWAAPAAVAVGLVLAAVFHGGSWVLCAVAKRAARRRGRTLLQARASAAPRTLVLRSAPLAGGWSGRGPPF